LRPRKRDGDRHALEGVIPSGDAAERDSEAPALEQLVGERATSFELVAQRVGAAARSSHDCPEPS
jgi:hypothetical protein